MVTTLGFFFLPLIELKPNRIASGVIFNLLELQGDVRYILLFALALIPFALAFRKDTDSRGWMLAMVGNLTIVLTLLLPAMAGEDLIANAAQYFDENVSLRNPRLLPSSAIAVGLLGGYITLYAGLQDMRRTDVSSFTRFLHTWISLPIIALLYSSGSFEIYSIIVEFNNNGELLGQRFIEHITFVSISILTGTVVGISLGLWASRDERISPVLLYAVGIIQTVPSLALFGLLLRPLAVLGDQAFTSVFVIFLATLLLAVVLGGGYVILQNRLPEALRPPGLIISAIAVAIPLTLFTVLLVSFLFRITLLGLTDEQFTNIRTITILLLAGSLVLWLLFNQRGYLRRFVPKNLQKYTRYVSLVVLAGGFIALFVMLFQSAQFFLRNVDGISDLTIRDLGVSGIGVAPALIALTLYSLLPLVRNTYAGLNNVDPAIIDSGKGMGMTPVQIFFRIELPLALPVIMAGVRNAGVALVGIGTIASVIGGGGLGDFVLQGIINTSIDLILLGAIPAIILALILDGGLRAIESLLTSPGLSREQ